MNKALSQEWNKKQHKNILNYSWQNSCVCTMESGKPRRQEQGNTMADLIPKVRQLHMDPKALTVEICWTKKTGRKHKTNLFDTNLGNDFCM